MTDGTSNADAGQARQYTFTFGDHKAQTEWRIVRSLTWKSIVEMLTNHPSGPKDGKCLVPAVFSGLRRRANDAQQIDVVFLDSDVGYTLEELRAAVAAKGWRAIISSTHSHMTTRHTCKRSGWDKFRQQHADADTRPAAYLKAKGYLPHIVDGARLVGETDTEVTFEHQPCPKFRLVMPLARSWVAAAYDSQKQANGGWKTAIEALATALSLHHDQSCTDTSRLFYLPRRPENGPAPETAVLIGDHCDIFALPPPPRPNRGSGRRRGQQRDKEGAGPSGFDAGGRREPVVFIDPDTGEIVDLTAWARRGGGRFQLRSALQKRRPGAFHGRVADGTKHHIECVNADEHTGTDADTATIVIDASESDNKGFVYFCHHNHCVGRDRLYFLKRMLEQRWLKREDLEDKDLFADGRPARPVIRYVAGQLHEMVDQAEAALLGAAGIYQRGPFLVRPAVVKVEVDLRQTAAMRVVEAKEMTVVERLTQHADWEKYDARSETWVAIDAPTKVAQTYLQRVGHWRLPVLAGIIDAPTLRPDGSVLDQPGYDAATGLLYDPRGATYPTLPPLPTIGAARTALQELKDLIGTFPFVNEAGHSVALSAILTACIRRSLRTAPMHAFSAPVAGSGKSTLVDLASLIANGREAAVISQGKTEEELEKRLGAMLMAGDLIIAIDNCENPISSEFLCSMLTQAKVRPRILGKSEVPELPANALITATGNNLVLAGDLTRRALLCQLDPKVERPELREFPTNPLVEAQTHRGRYLAAALTILRAYHLAGRPNPPPALGSFEEWSGWVRGALLWLDQADPVATMEELRDGDPRLDATTAVLTQWHDVMGDHVVSVREVIEKATSTRPSSQLVYSGAARPEYQYPDFREALLLVAGDGGAINGKRLGKWLSSHQNRIVLGLCLRQRGARAGAATWVVEEAQRRSKAA